MAMRSGVSSHMVDGRRILLENVSPARKKKFLTKLAKLEDVDGYFERHDCSLHIKLNNRCGPVYYHCRELL